MIFFRAYVGSAPHNVCLAYQWNGTMRGESYCLLSDNLAKHETEGQLSDFPKFRVVFGTIQKSVKVTIPPPQKKGKKDYKKKSG